MAVAAHSAGSRAALQYDEDVIRLFTIATLFWGVVAFAMGTLIAFQLAYPVLNLGLEWTTRMVDFADGDVAGQAGR